MASETPDARDRAVAAAAVGRCHAMLPYDEYAWLTDRITAALATARAEERAACVAVVEGLHRDAGDGLVGQTFTTTIALCAAALRARGEG